MSSNRKGYRGYICARMGGGRSAPQHIQQMVMRDYCKRNNMTFLLSATEYCMPGCTMILDAVLDELDHLEGILMYSIYLLPEHKEKRMELYNRLFAKNCVLHTAVEGHVVRSWDDAKKIEDIWLVKDVMDRQQPSELEWLTIYDREGTNAGNQLPRSLPEKDVA